MATSKPIGEHDIYFCFRPRNSEKPNWHRLMAACQLRGIKPLELFNSLLLPLADALETGPMETLGQRIYNMNFGNLQIK